jgi:isopentenyl phosphate kinase
MVPLLRGDLVPDTITGGWSVVSGDDLMVRLSELSRMSEVPRIERAILLMDVEGFFREGPLRPDTLLRSIDKENFHSSYIEWENGSRAPEQDMTGGMLKKLRSAHAIAGNGVTVNMIGGPPSKLEGILAGEDIGTTFPPFNGNDDCRSGICQGRGTSS